MTGSTPLLSTTFVLEVRISGVPRSKGRMAGREEGGGGGREKANGAERLGAK